MCGSIQLDPTKPYTTHNLDFKKKKKKKTQRLNVTIRGVGLELEGVKDTSPILSNLKSFWQN